MNAIPARPLAVIDADLRRVRANRNRFPSGSAQWEGSMKRIDQLLDERLLATAERLWDEAA